ncbi:benzoate/H(+) symporter BenE family transporter [Streptantibioticus ferralitis]|uniref:Benzoate/H(+) symporter BenE family transporter n=1 Tax=Streptantibioticus ferralitis TaxID=236510 RepID=A0ABT5YTZ7_9ACTN|nr:benzoate/H(+) symporter BenE family transporter [Streptantibioticus ferralitis]MDF2255029.1 benzoate/H(+) symporter BenE family transporter [Streptantibioticus ferralitis]
MEQQLRAEARRRNGSTPDARAGSTGDPARGLTQPLTAGVVTAVVGFSGAFAVVISGLRAVGADQRQAVSGLLALCTAMGLLGIGLSIRYRQPISIAWSTPGAALLVSTGRQPGGYSCAVGAFVIAGILLATTGLWRRLGRWVTGIPAPLASAMLAGVLLPVCLTPVQAAVRLPSLSLPAIATWALLTPFARRWATPAAFVVALGSLAVLRHPHLGSFEQLLPTPTLTPAAFSVGAVIGIALPLYVVTMAAQNVPGIAVLNQFGYRPPTRPILVSTGTTSALCAPFGGFALNLAAISAALAAGPDAGPDPKRRWIASATAGATYLGLGLTAGVSTALLTAAPPLLIEAVAGLALLGTLGSALAAAVADSEAREASMIAFAVTASGITVLGIGAAFWGLLAGLAFHSLPRTHRAAARPRA